MTRGDDISRLLAAERGAAPPAEAAEAGLNRLLSSLAAHAAPLPIAVGSLHLGWSVVGKWLGVGFVVGLGGAGAAAYVSSSNDGSNVAAAPVAVVSAAAHVAALPTPVPIEPQVAPVVSVATLVTSRESPRAEAAPLGSPLASAGNSGPGFDEELRLIAAAKRELDAGRVHAARALLNEHRQRFAAGVFGLERDGLSALASCSDKPDPELARAFASAHPSSPLLGQIQRRCGSESAALGSTPAADFPERSR
jgi:hypothetical protein